MGLKSRARILWRDFLLWGLRISDLFDETVMERFFLDSGSQHVWSSLDVHRTMLDDRIRVEAFRDAIFEAVREGERVLDVGTGTGILAFFAAKRAVRVYAVDSSKVIDYAKGVAGSNGIKNIEFIRSDLSDLSVPKVDCVVAELLGMEITDEGIVEKMAVARRFLKPGGRLIPASVDIFLVPVESGDVGLGFWDSLYGFDFSAVDRLPKEARNFEAGDRTRALSGEGKALSFDFMTAVPKDVESSLEFKVERDGVFHGCVCYFKARLSESVVLENSPWRQKTHWKQLFLPHTERAAVKKGDVIRVRLRTKNRVRGWVWDYEIIRRN